MSDVAHYMEQVATLRARVRDLTAALDEICAEVARARAAGFDLAMTDWIEECARAALGAVPQPASDEEPERCPTCGSLTPAARRVVDIGGTIHARGNAWCPDPWHREAHE